MNADDLTPAEKDAVQLHYLRRWLAAHRPPGKRIITHWRRRWPGRHPWGVQNHLGSVADRFPDDPAYVIQGS